MTAPLLVFGWGNRSRGDDAIGPMFVERLRTLAGAAADGRVDFLDDYQLQIEHALDLAGRTRVLFVDASRDCSAPFAATPLRAARATSFTTHALSPEALLQVYRDLHGAEAPPCTLLAIRARHFGLGEPPEALALSHMNEALAWGLRWLAHAGESCPTAVMPGNSHAERSDRVRRSA